MSDSVPLSNAVDQAASRQSHPPHVSLSKQPAADTQPTYTLLVRLPFDRGSFRDPPATRWDSAKDRRLWKLVSSGKGDLDWEGLADELDVELGFLLTQAAWLSERHMERIRKHIGRITGTAHSEAISAGRSANLASLHSRASPTSPVVGERPASPGASTPRVRAPISRTASTTTVTQSKVTGTSSRPQRAQRGASSSGRQPTRDTCPHSPTEPIRAVETFDSDSESHPVLGKNPANRLMPVARTARHSLGTLTSDGDAEENAETGDGDDDKDDEDDDDDSESGHLPFATTTPHDPLAATKLEHYQQQPRALARDTSDVSTTTNTATTTDSSASSSSAVPVRVAAPGHVYASSHDSSPAATAGASSKAPSRPSTGPISPRHRAQHLASLSPRHRSSADGSSAGSPSMGSSFSDLDDASVTQSALEEALLSNMRAQQGATSTLSSIAQGRMGSLRDVLGRRG